MEGKIGLIRSETNYEDPEGGRGTALLLNLGTRWGWVLTPLPDRFTSRKESRYPFYWRLGGP